MKDRQARSAALSTPNTIGQPNPLISPQIQQLTPQSAQRAIAQMTNNPAQAQMQEQQSGPSQATGQRNIQPLLEQAQRWPDERVMQAIEAFATKAGLVKVCLHQEIK